MDDLGSERQLIALEFSTLEKLIQKSTFVAIAVSVPRNKASDITAIFHGYLHELPFFEERVHGKTAAGRQVTKDNL